MPNGFAVCCGLVLVVDAADSCRARIDNRNDAGASALAGQSSLADRRDNRRRARARDSLSGHRTRALHRESRLAADAADNCVLLLDLAP
jgi:hypothetical protein